MGAIRRALKTIAVAIPCALVACPAPPVFAYQEAGHFYTVSLVTHLVKPEWSDGEATLIAFCAQLPDQSSDLDAVVVYSSSILRNPFGWLRWALSNGADSVWTRRMITIQQLLHGLTGGQASAVQVVAGDALGELRRELPAANDPGRMAALCALGFGFHFYGDAFAHQEMGDSGDDPDRMYPTGRGHAADLHYPDLPLCAGYAAAPRLFKHCAAGPKGRFARWADWWGKVGQYLGPNGSGGALDMVLHDRVVADVLQLGDQASDSNGWGDTNMADKLAAPLGGKDKSLGDFLAAHRSTEACEDVLSLALGDKGPLKGSVVFRCRDAWAAYSRVARAAFAKVPSARAALGIDLDSVYLDTPLLK